ncbi:hypothetical protein BKA62DRAFT_674638 [Auriculariales sp. MPI-PUGE-AT-0066]|nr:hypothetical protein BKA62DRAFT_674638 [Auriculariales sp. MPI-PUGE-AT-0066]
MHPAVFPSAALRAGAILWAPFSIRPAVRDAMSRLRPCIVARAQDEEVALVPLATFDGKPYHVFDDVRSLIIPFGDRSYHLPEVSETTEVRLDTKKGWKPAQSKRASRLPSLVNSAWASFMSSKNSVLLNWLDVMKSTRRFLTLLDLSFKRRVAIAKDMVQET